MPEVSIVLICREKKAKSLVLNLTFASCIFSDSSVNDEQNSPLSLSFFTNASLSSAFSLPRTVLPLKSVAIYLKTATFLILPFRKIFLTIYVNYNIKTINVQ